MKIWITQTMVFLLSIKGKRILRCLNLKIKIDNNHPLEAPHLFKQNAKVDEISNKAHHALLAAEYTIKAHDSVLGAESQIMKDRIKNQIPTDYI